MLELPLPPEVPEFDGVEGFVFPLSGLLGFEGFSTGVVTCPLSSSEPLEPSEQEVNVNARLSARMQAKSQWGG